ncbi:hypothetical protein R3P38DRAFT_3251769 [Favolaschia claudopus]|uniref:Uncharacterized protein n=1 Tax=Favolaschia claudopus TaxID=2862362 RepID=A0AAW0EE43_9AGAR
MSACRHYPVRRRCAGLSVSPPNATSVRVCTCTFLPRLRATSILAPHPNTLHPPTWEFLDRGNDVGGQRKIQIVNEHLPVALHPSFADVLSIDLPSHRSCLRPPPHLLLNTVVEDSHVLHYGSRRRKEENTLDGDDGALVDVCSDLIVELQANAGRLPPSQTLVTFHQRRDPTVYSPPRYPPAEVSRITFHAGTQTPLFRAPGPVAAPSTPPLHPTLILRLLYHTAMTRPPPHHPARTLHDLPKGNSTRCTSHPPHTPAPPRRRTPPCPFLPSPQTGRNRGSTPTLRTCSWCTLGASTSGPGRRHIPPLGV